MGNHDEFDLDVRFTAGNSSAGSYQLAGNGGFGNDDTDTCLTQCEQETCPGTCDTQCQQETCLDTCTCDTQCQQRTCDSCIASCFGVPTCDTCAGMETCPACLIEE